MSTLTERERATLAATADAFFPRGGTLPPSATDAGAVAYFETMLSELPGRTRFLIRLLVLFVEIGPWAFNRKRRFSRQSPTDRVATLRSWEKSPIYFLRISFQSLRTLIAMAYLASEDVAARLGAVPNLDPFGLGPREEAA